MASAYIWISDESRQILVLDTAEVPADMRLYGEYRHIPDDSWGQAGEDAQKLIDATGYDIEYESRQFGTS